MSAGKASNKLSIFINQCDAALYRCNLVSEKKSFRSDWWSSQYNDSGVFKNELQNLSSPGLTVYAGLKKYGSYQYNESGVAIDFRIGECVYVDVR